MSNQTKLMTVKEAIITAMSEEMRKDENVFLMGEDVEIFGGDFGTSVRSSIRLVFLIWKFCRARSATKVMPLPLKKTIQIC